MKLDSNIITKLFHGLDTQEILVNTGLFPQIVNCCFDPYEGDFKPDFLDIFLTPKKFEISNFVITNETVNPVSSSNMPNLIPSNLRTSSIQFPPQYTSVDHLNMYPYLPPTDTQFQPYSDNIGLELNHQINNLLPQSTTPRLYNANLSHAHIPHSAGGKGGGTILIHLSLLVMVEIIHPQEVPQGIQGTLMAQGDQVQLAHQEVDQEVLLAMVGVETHLSPLEFLHIILFYHPTPNKE